MSRNVKPRACESCDRQYQPTGSRERWCSQICSLWAHIKRGAPDECWPCDLRPTTAGYILITVRGEKVYAHVIACEEAHGAIPDGHYATHSCDNPPCCNPDHVRPRTPSFNSQEAHDRGRRANVNYAVGERHGKRKAAASGCLFI